MHAIGKKKVRNFKQRAKIISCMQLRKESNDSQRDSSKPIKLQLKSNETIFKAIIQDVRARLKGCRKVKNFV